MKACIKKDLLEILLKNTNLLEEEKRGYTGRKKRLYLEELLKDTEHLRRSGESRVFYKIINNSCKGIKSRTTFCREKNGSLLSNSSDIAKRWMEH